MHKKVRILFLIGIDFVILTNHFSVKGNFSMKSCAVNWYEYYRKMDYLILEINND